MPLTDPLKDKTRESLRGGRNAAGRSELPEGYIGAGLQLL